LHSEGVAPDGALAGIVRPAWDFPRWNFPREYGDIDERFHSGVESGLGELAELLRGDAQDLYPRFRERLAKARAMTAGVGRGFHDFVAGAVAELELGEP